jgi:hypothetical protein
LKVKLLPTEGADKKEMAVDPNVLVVCATIIVATLIYCKFVLDTDQSRHHATDLFMCFFLSISVFPFELQ